MAKKEQNDIAGSFLEGSDLGERLQLVLVDACQRTGFQVKQELGRSAWWGSAEIGAVHYLGELENQKAVLKIQGLKPRASESAMITHFAETNQSHILRPPHLLAHLPWQEDLKYEAIILEFIEGEKILHLPTNQAEIDHFFSLYLDYKKNCTQQPWLEKPNSDSTELFSKFAKLKQASLQIYPTHPLRKDDDFSLIEEAVKVLVDGYAEVELEFQHAHLADGDLYQVGNDVVVLSNLYWSWRRPLYDAIFGYHWFMYHLNNLDDFQAQDVENQRALWLNTIKKLPQAQGDGERLLHLALLERAAAGLTIDSLSANPKKPITAYLVEATRQQIRSILTVLS